MSVKHGLLALLANGPAHGYQLKNDFEAATGGAWKLNIGQVYTTLGRHERDGFAEVVEEDDERKVFALTAAGREELASWLAEPVTRTVEERDEVAMKVLLAAHGTGDPHAVVARQRAATTERIATFTRRKATVLGQANGSPAPLSTVVHLDRLILQCRAELDWLELVERRLELQGTTTKNTSTTATGAHA